MKKFGKALLKVLIALVIIIFIFAVVIAILNTVSVKSVGNYIDTFESVKYENQLEPTIDDNGYYTFTTDNEFKTMQLTDVHIGGGFLSSKKDNMAINAVASMVSEEKPDLVIVTGDVAFPVPYIAGTLNNKSGATLFADLMEKLGVYWCLCYGNHDTESYSYFNREDISELYENKEKYPHCLFQSGPEEVDGYGNYVVNVKKTDGTITESLFMFDSHSYIDNDYFGILWKYDCVHENQIEWYKDQIKALTEQNNGIAPKSLAFMHIPIIEMQEAYYEYRDNDFNDTENTQYLFGKAGETDAIVYSSKLNYGLFDAIKNSNSTQGMFFGHDHLNNFSLMYKDIQLSYGYSVDYLAYSGIAKYGAQRGCSIITIDTNGDFDISLENYYQDKYNSAEEKGTVSFDEYGSLDE